MKQLSYFLILVISFTKIYSQESQFSINNNNILWGFGANSGNQEGEFSNNFINATSYTPGDNDSAWTALSIYDGISTPGNAFWVRNTTGNSQGAYWGAGAPFNSPSQLNGAALFDSDFLDNNGVVGNLGGGSSPASHRGELISPRIDLTGNTDKPLIVKFFTYIRNLSIQNLSVSMSVDDGTTWTTTDYRNQITDLEQDFVNISFDNVTSGITDLSQVRIKFNFEGYYYFCFIDDVSILKKPDYDLGIAANDSFSSSIIDQSEQTILTNNAYFPIDQILTNNLKWGANVINYGNNDITVTENASLKITIDKNVSGAWQEVHSEFSPINSLNSNSASYINVDSLTNTSWLDVGEFRVTYSTQIGSVSDENNLNNSISHHFKITPNNYASKVEKDVNEFPLATRSAYPSITIQGDNLQFSEFGSVFYFPNASNTNLLINAINFKYYIYPNFNPARCGANQSIFVKIYEIINTNNGILSDWNQLSLISESEVELVGLGTSITSGFHDASATNLVDINTGQPLGSLSNGHYFISLTIDETNCSVYTGTIDTPTFAVSTDINYAGSMLNTSANYVINPSPLRVNYSITGESVYWPGFGAKTIPSIGIELSSDCLNPVDSNVSQVGNQLTADQLNATYQWIDCNSNLPIAGETNRIFTATQNGDYAVVITKNGCEATSSCYNVFTLSTENQELQNVMIFPNPTKGTVNLEFNKKFKNTIIQLYDIQGKKIFTSSYKNQKSIRSEINATPGIYILKVIADETISTYRLIKE